MDKITLVTFTDPMMGLSYECEPIFRKLETHFADRIEFRYVMSGLVRDVYELVDADDLKHGNDFAIRRYNAKLAQIYMSEESIGGLPINMTGFELFSVNETSSAPLNIAYKAAQIVDAEKADLFLYNLRFATIVECRPTTRTSELLKVAVKTGLDAKKFLTAFNDGSAEKLFRNDLEICARVGIHELPSYLVQYQSNGALIRGLASFADFAVVIDELSGLQPSPPVKSIGALRELLTRHPLISPIEIREAFKFRNVDEVRKFIKPLVDAGELKILDVPRGWFVEKISEAIT